MPSENTSKPGALVIDPQANMAALVADMLRNLGRRDIREAWDGNQAQHELRRRAYEVIIIDDALTGPDAVELVRRLRADATSPNRLTPIIMMAAAPDAARIAAARDAGVTEFLRKPFAAAHLKSRLDAIAGQPRPFIDATTYAGPDRRRRVQEIGTPDRRGHEPGEG
ncbi:response regulator [Devosia sediminis]|uniref:Response regulator n=1 Tax=Devosia sediminis TaxID=2798801 RepID=A0A934J0X4_9HYPH|nr:response regulator [Devosia sediminis]MBJ3786775.1 response regulator [Devosia sediminis]